MSIIEPYRGCFTNVYHFGPLSARVSFISSKYPTWCRSAFEPCRYELTHDFMYPSCLVYPRECHLYSCQSSFWFRRLTPMEAVSISVKLHKGLLRPEHLMKSSDNGDRVINAIGLESAKCSITMRWGKSCMRDREVPLFPIVPISSLVHDQCIRHRFLCFSPPFINLRMRFLLRGEGYNTLSYIFP
jgi:hypothetical protein